MEKSSAYVKADLFILNQNPPTLISILSSLLLATLEGIPFNFVALIPIPSITVRRWVSGMFVG